VAEDKDTQKAETQAQEESDGCSGDKLALCPLALLLGLGPTFKSRITDRLPEDFVEHVVGARREFLLAVRSLVDEALKSQEESLKAYRDRRRQKEAARPKKVAVE